MIDNDVSLISSLKSEKSRFVEISEDRWKVEKRGRVMNGWRNCPHDLLQNNSLDLFHRN